MSEKTAEKFDIFVDYLELIRIPGQAHIDNTISYLSQKYAEAPPDVLIALGRAAIPFLTKYRDTLAPNVPLIIANVPAKGIVATGVLGNAFWVATRYDFSKTMQLAERLQPDAKNVVVIGGAGDYDREWLDDARRELQSYSGRYTIRYLAGLPYGEMLKAVSQLRDKTIVIMSYVFVDGSGQTHFPREAATDVAKTSSAPVYAPVSSFLGIGIVGGYMDSWQAHGVAAADLALKILSGKDVSALSHDVVPFHTYRIDERQLKRWNLRKSRLPPDTEIAFHKFDLWEEYRWQIIGIAAILLMQAAAIVWLFLERRRRRAAEAELRRRLLEVIHLNRSAVAGALSASVAHELNQPLGAIQSYAEAAAIYLKSDPPNIERVEQILVNIRRDDERAASIISHLRGLLKKKDQTELQEFDLNDVIQDAMEIIGPEALKNGVALDGSPSNGPLPVRGDQIQLQQVILNLALNGIDAMQHGDSGRSRMSIQTALVDDSSVEVSVADSGAGIPPDKLNQVFDTFYTTKRQGTGLGLSIARTIVEAYGGRIWAENRRGGGATFRFTLPLARAIDP